MEKQIALVNKANQRVISVLVVESLDKSHIGQWATDELDVIAVKDSTPYVNGLWDGKEFTPPDEEYLKEIGLMSAINQELKAEAEAKETAKAAILDRIGLTADELKTILG
jgi:hypothetical protein